MSGTISTDRLFSLPCFEGLRLFRRYSSAHPQLGVPELLSLIDSVEADAHNLDMEASVHLSELVEDECPLDGQDFYQTCIQNILFKRQPIWTKLMRQGRQRFVKQINPNDRDVFIAAGLMENPTPVRVVKWWDSVSGHARLVTDQVKMEQGRAAEILSLEYERERLKEQGINDEPEWPGFDDNFAGYDVKSYTMGAWGKKNKLIEVKSTTASPLSFHVSRNEWRTAERAGEAYHFHIWDMTKTSPVLFELSVADVASHIPTDSGKGQWTNVRIPVQTH